MTEFKFQLTWVQNGEPISGGFNGSNSGVINRPLREVLNNTRNLNERLSLLETSFIDKTDSFFITQNKVRYRTIMNNNPVLAYLPDSPIDGFIAIIYKIGAGTLSIIPRSAKIYEGNIDQLYNSTDLFSILNLEYVLSNETWFPIYESGTWLFQ